MQKISIVRIPENSSYTTRDKLLNILPESFSERANRYLDAESSISFLTRRLLLKKAMVENRISPTSLEGIRFSKYGKPNLKDINFSISHSNGYVVLAYSTDFPIGIDIEKKKSVDLNLFKYLFTALEWKSIIEAETPLEQFYWFWVRKEAMLKVVGCSLKHLKQLEVLEERGFYKSKRYHFESFDFDPEFNGLIAMEEKVRFDLEVIDFMDLVRD